MIVGSLSVCLIVCVSGHFTTLHLSTYRNRKWNRSHNDRSPRLCVSPRRRPHVTAVCPTVVCKFLYYIIILLIILSSIFISTLYYYTLLHSPDSWVIASGAAKNSCARTMVRHTAKIDCLLSLSRYNEDRDSRRAGWDVYINRKNVTILQLSAWTCSMVFRSIRSIRSNILDLNSLYDIILIFILPPCKCTSSPIYPSIKRPG